MLVLRNIDALFDLLPGFYAGLGRAGEGKEGSCYICMRRPCLAQWMAAIMVMLLLLLLQHQNLRSVCAMLRAFAARTRAAEHTSRSSAGPLVFPLPEPDTQAFACCAAPDCTAGRKSQAERDGCPLFFPHERCYFNAGKAQPLQARKC